MGRLKNAERRAAVRTAVDRFWMENHYPPTTRDLMAMTGISSTSVVRYYVTRLSGVRMAKYGRIIPLWVDSVFETHQSRKV
jgi:hypothetical protein